MRPILKQTCIFIVLVLLVFLCSCHSSVPVVEYDGRLLSSEEIWELGESFRGETETETETETEAQEETKEPADGIVHWTAGGEVWHESRSCNRISQRSPMITGSIDEAIAAKKERACSVCCE